MISNQNIPSFQGILVCCTCASTWQPAGYICPILQSAMPKRPRSEDEENYSGQLVKTHVSQREVNQGVLR